MDDLIETISLVAETQELRAERDGDIHGYVLESKIRKGLGWVIQSFQGQPFLSDLRTLDLLRPSYYFEDAFNLVPTSFVEHTMVKFVLCWTLQISWSRPRTLEWL